MRGDAAEPHPAYWEAEAPGRLDVMGGIADYSGSLVLEMPIRETARVRVVPTRDGQLSAVSREVPAVPPVSVGIHECLTAGEIDYLSLREHLAQREHAEWAGYVLGCALVLMREKGATVTGLRIELASDVPVGKGVSSSAAIEIATLSAMASMLGLSLGRTELPRLGQMVENLVVGAPCGLMDQLTCYLGRSGMLLPIRCQPDQVRAPLPVPSGWSFIGIDSGIRHAVTGASYGEVRAAAFMGYSLIAGYRGVTPDRLRAARETGNVSELPYHGYLANISREDFDTAYRDRLPRVITGRDFLEAGGELIDPVTTVDPEASYALQACTRHPVYENRRVEEFMKQLETLHDASHEVEAAARHMGSLMAAAHRSYSDCGLGHPVTDALVEGLIQAGPAMGIYGAKITGGGSGGTVCVLCRDAEGITAAQRVAAAVRGDSDQPVTLFTGSSPGAIHRGVRKGP